MENNFKELIITKTNNEEFPFHMKLHLEDEKEFMEEDFKYIDECLVYINTFCYPLEKDPNWKPTEGSWLKVPKQTAQALKGENRDDFK